MVAGCKNIINAARGSDDEKESVFRACARARARRDRFYVLETFVCSAHASRSDRHVLRRFLPVRFESCLNDTPRFPSIQLVSRRWEYSKGASAALGRGKKRPRVAAR